MHFIDVKLDDALNILGISAHKLAKESKIKPNTIYDLADKRKNRITFDTLTKIIYTLNKIAADNGKSIVFTVEDILEYSEVSEK